MRATTIRFGGRFYSVLQGAARAEGVSLAAYVREAAMMRWAYESGVVAARGRERARDVPLAERDAVLAAVREALKDE